MKKIFTLMLLLCSSALFSQTMYYVKTTGSDNNNGTSWATAFKTLQKAINTISTGQVWVAAGTYYPDEGTGQTDNSRSAYFTLKNNVAIYGGFAGDEATLNLRNWKTNVTTLSGEIQRDGDSTNNSLHVVKNSLVQSTAILDGFTITGGNANGGDPDNSGGGMLNNLSFPTINNCVFTRNVAGSGSEGTGAAMDNTHASPIINNCSFTENTCYGGGTIISSGGGAIFNDASHPEIFNCSFTRNKGYDGGAILNWGSNPRLVNCSFLLNQATGNYGGAMYNLQSSPSLINCSFYGNAADIGGGMYNTTYSYPAITNCIFWWNTSPIKNRYYAEPVVRYSIVQDGYSGTGNLNLNPLFVDAPNEDLRLQACSPAIDMGNSAANTTTTDLGGNQRIVSGKVDMGAYEYQEPPAGIIYVKSNANGNNTGTSWTNAFTKLQDALVAAGCSGGQVWVAKGTYFPDETGTTNSNDRAASFNLNNRTTIYGGFAGMETSLEQRSPGLNATILSGEIQQDGNSANNSYFVVNSDHVNNTAVLDGFIVTGGYADDKGGGLYNAFSLASLRNCSFTRNSAPTGGGVVNFYSSTSFTNCSFISNTAQNRGGGMYNQGESPQLTNCSFAGNTVTGSQLGGGIYNIISSPVINNSILWQNSPLQIDGSGATVNYSIVQGIGIYPGTGNLNFDPHFADPVSADLHLLPCSPALDAGNSAYVSATTDQDGNARIFGSKVDMGAYEFQGRIYVNERATGSNTGSSWQNAFTKLQDALNQTHSCTVDLQIWVASGTYYPDEGSAMTNDDRAASFHMKNNVWILGGFSGTELSVNQRNPSSNISILSGDIQQDNDHVNNSFHVVVADSVDNTARLNGFTIIGGNANGTAAPDNQGGGIRIFSASPAIYFCRIAANAALYGGGIYNDKSSPSIGMSSFVGNTASYGGGISNVNGSSAEIVRCIFETDSALNGGAIYNNRSNPDVSNSIFYKNKATNGGAVYNEYASPTLFNCTLSDNTALFGGAMSNMNSHPGIRNSILWNDHPFEIDTSGGSAVITHSIVQGGYPGEGNLDADPQFVKAGLADFHLRGCSPAIDAGDNSWNIDVLDLDGNWRVMFTGVDMGAYEFQPGGPGGIVYVNRHATGNNTGTSWQNAFTSLQDALVRSGSCKATEIWVTADTYYPDEGTGLANNDRTLSFVLKNNVTLLGGFNGTESPDGLMQARTGKTILSGEIQQDGDSSNNAYHVVKALNTDQTAILQDFIITSGNANADTVPDNQGGGIYINAASPSIKQTFITGNQASAKGGGVYNLNSYFLTLTDCRISTNNSGDAGGGVYNDHASGSLINCLIAENRAANQGGGIFNDSSTIPVINSAFYRNQAPYGGGMYNNSNYAPVVNCTFYGNVSSQHGGGIFNNDYSAAITNCILWANSSQIYNTGTRFPTVSYSLVQAGYRGSNIIYSDPMFIGADTGNLRLFPGSPAVDAGNNAVVSSATDLGGSERIFNARVDMGAFEYNTGVTAPPDVLTLIPPDDFSVFSDPGTCGAAIPFTGDHAATTTGGIGPATITYEPASGSALAVGETLVTVTANDSSARSATGKFWVTVMDNAAPVISNISVDKPLLYPPNHKMQTVTVNYSASDNCPGVTTQLSVSSNEPQYGSGSGDTGPDWQVVNDHKLQIRAERSGSGSDRIYTILLTATDASGNTSTAIITVIVPHDKASVMVATAATTKETIDLQVKAMPNPSAESFTLYTESASTLPLSINVMDAAGRKIESRSGVVANGTLSIGHTWRPGVYYVQVMQGDVLQTIKLVKQNW